MHRFEHPWIYGHHWGNGFGWWPGMLLSVLSTLLWVALLIGLAWLLLRWILPYLKLIIADIFGSPPADLSPLEILRERYAAGEIDDVTFERMRERLEASYQCESTGYPRETWTGYRDIH
jgi:putative membrane protein